MVFIKMNRASSLVQKLLLVSVSPLWLIDGGSQTDDLTLKGANRKIHLGYLLILTLCALKLSAKLL